MPVAKLPSSLSQLETHSGSARSDTPSMSLSLPSEQAQGPVPHSTCPASLLGKGEGAASLVVGAPASLAGAGAPASVATGIESGGRGASASPSPSVSTPSGTPSPLVSTASPS